METWLEDEAKNDEWLEMMIELVLYGQHEHDAAVQSR